MILQHISTHTSFYVKEYTRTHRSQLIESLSQSTFQHTAQALCAPLKGPGARSCRCWILAKSLISSSETEQSEAFRQECTQHTGLSYVYPNKHQQLCWVFLEGRWVGFSSLNLKHLIWLVLKSLFNSWMEGSIVREQFIHFRCLQYDEGNSTPSACSSALII